MNVSKKVNNWVWWSLPKPPERTIDIADIIEFNAPCDGTEERNAKLNLVPKGKLDLIISVSKHSRRVFTGYKRTRNHRQVLEVRTDGVAGCLRTPCGGSSRQIVFIAENGNVKTRLLTVRETARLMGAPDSFKIPGSYNDGYMAMGDGVAFPVARYLAEHLLHQWQKWQSEGVTMNITALQNFFSKNKMGTKGTLCLGLVVSREALNKGLTLKFDSLLTENKGQISLLGKAHVLIILKDYGITRVLAEEGGRTNRGNMGLAKRYVEFLNEQKYTKAQLKESSLGGWIESKSSLPQNLWS